MAPRDRKGILFISRMVVQSYLSALYVHSRLANVLLRFNLYNKFQRGGGTESYVREQTLENQSRQLPESALSSRSPQFLRMNFLWIFSPKQMLWEFIILCIIFFSIMGTWRKVIYLDFLTIASFSWLHREELNIANSPDPSKPAMGMGHHQLSKFCGIGWCVCVCMCVCVCIQLSSVTQSYLTLCDPMKYSMQGLPVHH